MVIRDDDDKRNDAHAQESRPPYNTRKSSNWWKCHVYSYDLPFQDLAARPATNAASTPDNNILLTEDRRAAAASG